MFSSYHHLSLYHARRLVIGFNALIILCGLKTLQIMNVPGKKTCTQWSIEDTDRMLDLLIDQKSRIGQTSTFPQSVYSEVARNLGDDKTGNAVSNKYQSVSAVIYHRKQLIITHRQLKKNLRSIERYNARRSGCLPFHPTHGVIVRSGTSDVTTWDEFIAEDTATVRSPCFLVSNDRSTDSIQSRDMAQFKNKGWLFYNKMVLLAPNAGAEGDVTHAAGVDPSLNLANLSTVGTPAFQSNDLPFDAIQNIANIDVDALLQVGRDMFSTTGNPSLQLDAVDTAVSALEGIVVPTSAPTHSRSSGDHRTFSDASSPYPRPSSSRTSLNASKRKSRAHTPATSLSHKTSCCTSSVGASKRSRVSQAESSMANAAALNGVVGVLSRATDCMSGITDILQTEPEHCDPPNIVREASAMLNNDNHLFTAEIRGKLAYAFIKDKDLCQVYIELTNPELQKSFVYNWYQETYGQLPPEPSSTNFFSGTQTAQPSVYTGQSDGNVPSLGELSGPSQLPPTQSTGFFSGAQVGQLDSSCVVGSSSSGAIQSNEANMSYNPFCDSEFLYDATPFNFDTNM
ncbi:hypothetical protein JVT61DRAFT_865 [Boletus reticuloceps]|uniref:Uncharacterized protein n=1 Tax=Boletus reticuloceps TaxID=495285 RepID=A0A8I2YTR8_9AGAM|nr:hypothetical protein JVT61DRAFT_865 [Boletus reticuloceps]